MYICSTYTQESHDTELHHSTHIQKSHHSTHIQKSHHSTHIQKSYHSTHIQKSHDTYLRHAVGEHILSKETYTYAKKHIHMNRDP